jgi:hypothetical protein
MSCNSVLKDLAFPAHRQSSFCITFPMLDHDTCPPTRAALPGGAIVWFILKAIGSETPKLIVKSDAPSSGNALTIDSAGGVDADVQLSLTIAATALVNADEGRYDAEIAVQVGSQLRGSAHRTSARVVTSAVVE